MADETAAEKAIAQLNGTEIAGRTLTVNEARPMEKSDFGNRGGGGSGRPLVSTFKRFLRPSDWLYREFAKESVSLKRNDV